MSSPTARTLKLLRDEGYIVDVVERWIPQARKRRDLWGFADLAGIHPAHPGVLLVQATSASNHAARRQKLAGLDSVQLALRAGCRIQIISWGKSRKTKRWTPRIEAVISDQPDPTPSPRTHTADSPSD